MAKPKKKNNRVKENQKKKFYGKEERNKMCKRLKLKEVSLGWERQKGAERRQDKRGKGQSEPRKKKSAFWEKGVKQEREQHSI